MTNKQESRLSMYLTVKEFQANYTTITNALPNYSANSTVFLATIVQINTIAEQQKTSKKGLATGKQAFRNVVVTQAADVARKLTAFAKFTNNATLLAEVALTESKLKQAADTALRDYAQLMYNRAQSNVAALATYNITAATQTAFQTAITNYNNSLGKPGAGRSEGKQVTKQLATLFKTADLALENMDLAVEVVRLNQANFYNGYQAARKMIMTGIGKQILNGLVKDADTAAPMKGVTVTIVPDANTAALAATGKAFKIVKKTAAKGGFRINNLANGTYQVSLKKAGYTDQLATINVTSGELTRLVVELKKV